METTFNDYAYLEISYIRINSMGKLVIKAMYSDVACEQTLEQLFIPFNV